MKLGLRPKDVVTIGAVMTLSFPILYVVLLFLTGNARVEFGPKRDVEDILQGQEVKMLNQTARRDSLAALNSRAFEALQKERAEILNERELLSKQQERIDMLQRELEQTQQQLVRKRDEMAKLVTQSSDLESKRIRQLANVYAAMRPAEAAQILETLDDDLLVKILTAIGDDRQKAKIVASLSREKAVALSKTLGTPVIQ